MGHVICAVVADTKQHAKLAASALKITYEDLKEDPIFTVEVRRSLTSLSVLSRVTKKPQRADTADSFRQRSLNVCVCVCVGCRKLWRRAPSFLLKERFREET